MPAETISLIEVLFTVFVAVITGFAIAGAVQAWRRWSITAASKSTWVVVDRKVRDGRAGSDSASRTAKAASGVGVGCVTPGGCARFVTFRSFRLKGVEDVEVNLGSLLSVKVRRARK